MTNISPDLVPHKTAFVPQYSLFLPVQHLLGNKIGFALENDAGVLMRGGLELSYWKFEKDRPYAGRIHIFPVAGLELRLIEDFAVGEMPEDYPKIGERTTSKDEVNLSLLYPSMEFWNFRIHYNSNGTFVDKEAACLLAEGRIRQTSMNNYEETEREIYNPPRKAVQAAGKWIVAPASCHALSTSSTKSLFILAFVTFFLLSIIHRSFSLFLTILVLRNI